MRMKNRTFILIYILEIVFLVGAIVVDILPFTYIKGIEKFFCYDYSLMTSSLLAVWAFITVFITYYIEKKDEQHYGVTNWLIWRRCLKAKIWMVGSCFLIHPLIILVAIVIELRVTLVVVMIILMIFVVATPSLAMKSTDAAALRKGLLGIIGEESNYRTFKEILNRIEYTREENLDFLLDAVDILMEKYFVRFGKIVCWESIDMIGIFVKKIEEGKIREDFFKNLVIRVQNKGKTDIAALTIIGFSALKEDGYKEFREILSVVNDGDKRRALLLRGIIYNICRDEIEREMNRRKINEMYIKEMYGSAGVSVEEEELTQLKEFLEEMCEIYPNYRVCLNKIFEQLC